MSDDVSLGVSRRDAEFPEGGGSVTFPRARNQASFTLAASQVQGYPEVACVPNVFGEVHRMWRPVDEHSLIRLLQRRHGMAHHV